MESAKARAYNGGLWEPQRGPGAEPSVGVKRAKPTETESFSAFGHQKENANWPTSLYLANSIVETSADNYDILGLHSCSVE